MHCFAWFWFILFGLVIAMCTGGQYRQERAIIAYYNHKYVENAQAFTGRLRRGEPYRTNVTAKLIKPWANNVTIHISYRVKGTPTPLVFSIRYCDGLKSKWLSDFLKIYSNLSLRCPLLAGTYSLINMELPPKNFPLPLLKGDIQLNITTYITHTKELILLTTLAVHAT